MYNYNNHTYIVCNMHIHVHVLVETRNNAYNLTSSSSDNGLLTVTSRLVSSLCGSFMYCYAREERKGE